MGLNKLYNEGVLEVLKRRESDSIDMIFGDPDYNVGINYDGERFRKSWDEYIDWYCRLATKMYESVEANRESFFRELPSSKRLPRSGMPR